jgi:hypothetical protein
MTVPLLVGLCLTGCAGLRPARFSPAPVSNPLPVQAANDEVLWERTIDVLHEYHFSIERENRVARVIETAPRIGSSLLEPWHKDSPGFANRLESSLQSIQRRVVVTLIPADEFGSSGVYHVLVQAFKEREDIRGKSVKSPGGATFLESEPLGVDLDPVVGQTGPSEFIPLGRDAALEQALLQSLRAAYSR